MNIIKLLWNLKGIKKYSKKKEAILVDVELSRKVVTGYMHRGLYKKYNTSRNLQMVLIETYRGVVLYKSEDIVDIKATKEEGLRLYIKIFKCIS